MDLVLSSFFRGTSLCAHPLKTIAAIIVISFIMLPLCYGTKSRYQMVHNTLARLGGLAPQAERVQHRRNAAFAKEQGANVVIYHDGNSLACGIRRVPRVARGSEEKQPGQQV